MASWQKSGSGRKSEEKSFLKDWMDSKDNSGY